MTTLQPFGDPSISKIVMRSLPPIFVISLPGSPRRAAMVKHLAPWRGVWQFVDAVDGSAISQSDLNKVYDRRLATRSYGRELSGPEIGCALSHRAVYSRILEAGLESALVLEDDTIPKLEFFDFPFQEVGLNFDVISLHTLRALVRRQSPRQVGEYKMYRSAGGAAGTAAYLVTLRGAARLLSATKPISNVADWPILPEFLDFYVLASGLVTVAGDSTIKASREGVKEQACLARRPLEKLVKKVNPYISYPLFMEYVVNRDKYLGVRDYLRREIIPDMRMMMPWWYFRLRHERDQDI